MAIAKMWRIQIESLLGICQPVPGTLPTPALRVKKEPVSREERTRISLDKIAWALGNDVLTARQVAEKIDMDEHYIAKLLRTNLDRFSGDRRKVGGCYKFFWRLNGQDESEKVS